MSSWTTKNLSELIFSINDEDDPIDAILSGCLGSVKELIENVMEAERDIFCGIGSFKRGCARKDYRNGYYECDFESCFGVLKKLRVLRTRSGKFRSMLFECFERRQKKVNELIRTLFLCGVSQRDISEVLKPFLGIEPFASTVSRIAKGIDEEVTNNHLERCFREFRRRLRPIGCMKNTASCERMIYSICKRLDLRRKERRIHQSSFLHAA